MAAGSVHVALLRGINLGGKNRLPMKDLAEMFRKVGCDDVQTYVQSGNVLFRAPKATAGRVPARVSEAIERDFGLDVPVVTRTAAELAKIVGRNPFLGPGVETKALHVAFLLDRPRKKNVDALDPKRSPPDRFAVAGREIYLHCPNGVARTKLTTQYFDSRLETTSTLRNWKTTLKLLELAKA